jgi:KipI family sensor histidine kinase inhibitor
MPATVLPLGDRAFLIREADHATIATARRAAALATALREERLPAVIEVVAAGASVAVYIDPLAPEAGRVEQRLRIVAAHLAEIPTDAVGAHHEIPVRYDGPDLHEVATRTGLSPDEVVARHAAASYHVLAVGFRPGFGYLGPLDARLQLPRRDSPRPRVPAGSVAIAADMTAVYPGHSPGGWHLIGSTEVSLFDPSADPPGRLAVGDTVRFVPR